MKIVMAFTISALVFVSSTQSVSANKGYGDLVAKIFVELVGEGASIAGHNYRMSKDKERIIDDIREKDEVLIFHCLATQVDGMIPTSGQIFITSKRFIFSASDVHLIFDSDSVIDIENITRVSMSKGGLLTKPTLRVRKSNGVISRFHSLEEGITIVDSGDYMTGAFRIINFLVEKSH